MFKIDTNKDGDFVLQLSLPEIKLIVKSDDEVIEAIADMMAITNLYERLKCPIPTKELDDTPEPKRKG